VGPPPQYPLNLEKKFQEFKGSVGTMHRKQPHNQITRYRTLVYCHETFFMITKLKTNHVQRCNFWWTFHTFFDICYDKNITEALKFCTTGQQLHTIMNLITFSNFWRWQDDRRTLHTSALESTISTR